MSDKGFAFSPDHLREIASDVLKFAREQGASACETDVSEGFGESVSVRKGEIDTIEHNRDKGLGVTVYLGQRRGHASSSDFSREALKATVDAALSIARFTAPDPFAGLADEALLAKNVPDLDLHHPWRIGVERSLDIARECEQAAFAVSRDISNSEGASVSTQEAQFISANSLGFIGGYATSRHSISCSVIAGSGDAMQREFWYDMRRDAADLEMPATVGRKAGERACTRLGARQIETCEVPVLFEAPVAASLISSLAGAVSGGALYRKSSFLLDSIGKQIFAPHVRIVEKPHLRKMFGSAPFDDEGVATRERDIIVDGVLQGYFLSSYSARKLGMQTTGNAGGPHLLEVSSTGEDFPELLRRMERGLLVTELLGQGVNPITGDYSRGAAGFWVERGQIQHAVEEITIAGNLRDMFLGIVAIGNDTLPRSARQCGSILIERMTVAGSSPA